MRFGEPCVGQHRRAHVVGQHAARVLGAAHIVGGARVLDAARVLGAALRTVIGGGGVSSGSVAQYHSARGDALR